MPEVPGRPVADRRATARWPTTSPLDAEAVYALSGTDPAPPCLNRR
jgi:hypothetical protein